MLVTVLLVACGGDGEVAAGELEGRDFVSRSVKQDGAPRPLVAGTEIRLGFHEGRVSVQAGCNSMGGPYALEGGILRLTEGLATTEMGCDPERHDQDAWISTFLGSQPRVALDGDVLTLSGSGTVIELIDREVAEPDLPLVGTLWHLESIVQGETVSSVPSGLSATLRFPDEGTVEVFTGCNTGEGLVELGDGTFRIRDLATTLIGCEGPRGALEADVLEVLTASEIEYSIEASVLSLRAGDVGLDWRA